MELMQLGDGFTVSRGPSPVAQHAIVECKNGWRASIVRGFGTYGSEEGLFELAVLNPKHAVTDGEAYDATPTRQAEIAEGEAIYRRWMARWGDPTPQSDEERARMDLRQPTVPDLSYVTPLTNDVLGYLTEADVVRVLRLVAALPRWEQGSLKPPSFEAFERAHRSELEWLNER